jgi:membrane-associated protein
MPPVLALNPLSATDLLGSFGTIGVLVVLFAETGLLIGFFLPGDSLLFTAGLLCATGAGSLRLSLPWVLVAAVAGALLGAQAGFLIGRRAGRALTARADRPRLAAGLRRAEELFTRYGPAKAIVLARFIPVVRTVLNPLAGALGTPVAMFTVWQSVGGVLWTVGLVLAGYALGAFVPGVDAYLLPVIAVVVVVSLIPLARELLRERRRHRGPDGGATGGRDDPDDRPGAAR